MPEEVRRGGKTARPWVGVGQRGGTITVSLGIKAGAGVAPALENLIHSLWAENSAARMIVDLDCCPAVDSTFMGMLVALAREAEISGREGRLAVYCPPGRARRSMDDLGLQYVLDFCAKRPVFPRSMRLHRLPGRGGLPPPSYLLLKHQELAAKSAIARERFGPILERAELEKKERPPVDRAGE